MESVANGVVGEKVNAECRQKVRVVLVLVGVVLEDSSKDSSITVTWIGTVETNNAALQRPILFLTALYHHFLPLNERDTA